MVDKTVFNGFQNGVREVQIDYFNWGLTYIR